MPFQLISFQCIVLLHAKAAYIFATLNKVEKVLVNAAKVIFITNFFTYDSLKLRYLTIFNRNEVTSFHIKYCAKRNRDLKDIKMKK